MALTEAPPRPRGRPRSMRCHVAILRATVELLDERRYGEVTMESIAERAGVAKQTLYKWWPSKARLAMEAFTAGATAAIPSPESDDAAADLMTLTLHTCRALSQGHFGHTVAGLIADAQSDPDLAVEFRDTYIGTRRLVATGIIQRGMASGEFKSGLDVSLVLDLIYGPIWYRLLLRNAALDDAFARAIVSHVLATIGKRPQRRSAA